jgi:hypothetical protein
METIMDNLYILVFFVLIGIVLALGSRSHNNKNISTSSFENQYVSFNYPNYLKLVDQSTTDNCQIYLFNGTPERADPTDKKYLGDISTTESNFASSITDPTKNANINGTPAIEYHHDIFSNELFIPSKSILIKFNANTQTQINSKSLFGYIYKNTSQTSYDIIKNSLKIK